MKRVNSFLIAAFVAASSMFVVSCTEDGEVDDPTIKVTLTYLKDGGTMTKDIEVGSSISDLDAGTALTFAIEFTMGTNPIKEVHIKSVLDGKTYNVLDSVDLDKGLFNSGAKTLSYTYKTAVGNVDEQITFNLLDTKSNGARADLKIAAPKPDVPQTTKPYYFIVSNTVVLGGQSASTGSSYDVKTGKVWTLKEATSNSGSIDFLYYYGGTNKASIGAPADATGVQVVFSSSVKNWTTKNATKLKYIKGGVTSIDPDNQDDIDDWYDDDAITGLTATDLSATDLKTGDIVAFSTVGNLTGFIFVETTGTSATGNISIKIVQKKNK